MKKINEKFHLKKINKKNSMKILLKSVEIHENGLVYSGYKRRVPDLRSREMEFQYLALRPAEHDHRH